MKKDKMAKMFSVIILVLILIINIASGRTYATSDISNIFSGADNFLENGEKKEENDPTFNINAMQNTVDIIYNTLLIIGIIVATIVGMILGIQFITGSVEQKGKIKESIMPYVAGCVVIFSAFGIWKLVIVILR